MSTHTPVNHAALFMDISRRLFKRAEEVESEAWDLRYKAAGILAEKHGVEEVEIGGWECKNSDIGICYYNVEEDPCRDDCLVCHHPSERK